MKKFLLYFLIIVLIVINLYLICFDVYSSIKHSYIIFDNNNILKIDDKRIKKIDSKNLKKINYSNVEICDDFCISGYINNDEYLEVYNENYEKIYLSPTSFIKKGEVEIENYSQKSINNITTDDEILISKILYENNIEYNIEDLFITKIKINDRSSAYSLEPYSTGGPSNNNLSLIFVSNESEYEIIYMKKNSPRLSTLNKVMDINKDNLIEIILLSDVPGSAGNECYSLYQFNKETNKYEPIINCEEE